MPTGEKVMKSSLKIVLLLVSFFGTTNFCHAQESITLKALGGKAVQKQWEVNLPTPLDQLTFNYAILKDGVATYSRQKRALQCYGFDNKLRWEKVTREYPAAQLFASPSGEYLTVCYIIAEDAGTTIIYNNRGEVLRPSDYCMKYFSVDSKYLIGSGSRPMVLNSRTGEILWSRMEEGKYRNWKVIPTQDNQLVVYANGSLETFDLPTGRRLWQREVGPSVSSTVNFKVAKNGSLIALQFLVFVNINKNYTFIYNKQGDLLHKIEKPIIFNKTNGGTIEAISEDGRYLGIGDFEEFYVCSGKTLERVFTLHEKVRPLDIQKFTQNLLAFKPSYDAKKTRVLILNDNGQVKQAFLFNQVLNFDTRVNLLETEKTLRKGHSSREQAIPVIPALQIDEKRPGGVMLSLYSIALQSIKD